LPNAQALVTTFGHALRIAGARILQLDSREIGVLVVAHTSDAKSAPGALFYDVAPGGAGHVKELLSAGRVWLNEARTLLFGNPEHDELCELACLDCLLTFEAQAAYRSGHLQRRDARKAMDQLLGIADIAPAPEPAAPLPLTDEWAEVVELLEEQWHPLAAALASAGVRAPDDVHRDLVVGRWTSGAAAVMHWEGRDETLAVVRAGTVGDGCLVFAEPGGDPGRVVQSVRDHLARIGDRSSR